MHAGCGHQSLLQLMNGAEQQLPLLPRDGLLTGPLHKVGCACGRHHGDPHPFHLGQEILADHAGHAFGEFLKWMVEDASCLR